MIENAKFTSTAQTKLPYPAALPYCQRRWSHPTQLCCTALLNPTTLIAPHPHALRCLPLSPFPPQYQVSPFRTVFLNLWVETHGGLLKPLENRAVLHNRKLVHKLLCWKSHNAFPIHSAGETKSFRSPEGPAWSPLSQSPNRLPLLPESQPAPHHSN